MWESIDGEIARLSTRPSETAAPAVLSAMAVQTLPTADEYGQRIREVLRAGLATYSVSDASPEDLPVGDLPEWFSGAQESVPPDVARGRTGFTAQRDSEPFDPREWLEMLDPESRQWQWWDATAAGPRLALIWVDASGEVVFNCDELHWLLHSAGARAVVGPLLLPSLVWNGLVSIGLPQ